MWNFYSKALERRYSIVKPEFLEKYFVREKNHLSVIDSYLTDIFCLLIYLLYATLQKFKGLPPLATVKKSIFFYCIFLKYKYLRICPENFKSIRTKLTEIWALNEKNPLCKRPASLPERLAERRAAESTREGRMLRRQHQISVLQAASSAEELRYGPGIDDSM